MWKILNIEILKLKSSGIIWIATLLPLLVSLQTLAVRGRIYGPGTTWEELYMGVISLYANLLFPAVISPKEVAFRVKAHLRRKHYFEQEYREEVQKIAIGQIEIDEKKSEVRKAGVVINLTAKEYQLLLYLAKHPNKILSKQRICDMVWGGEYNRYDNTIMVHMRRLREKIEDDPSAPEYIITVKGLGYKLAVKDE